MCLVPVHVCWCTLGKRQWVAPECWVQQGLGLNLAWIPLWLLRDPGQVILPL